MSTPRANTSTNTNRRNAFTIVELLVVAAIIIVLIAAVLFASPRIIRNQQVNATNAVLKTLDRALDEYYFVVETPPRYNDDLVDDYVDTFDNAFGGAQAESQHGPIVNYRGATHPVLPDAWMFYTQAKGFGDVDEILKGIPESFTRSRVATDATTDQSTSLVRFVDAWGNPILFVHPDNDAAQELFGLCQNNRPYFMSAGPDQRYGFFKEITGTAAAPPGGNAGDLILRELREALDDNLYSNPPGNFVIEPDALRAENVRTSADS